MPIVTIRRKRVEWTPAMDQELVNLWDYGVHRNEIAERFGVTIASVEGRYYKLKREKEQANG